METVDLTRTAGSDGVQSVLDGGGENGARMRAIDWSATPLGPVDRWPQSLKTCVRIILTSRQPMFVWWGSERINLYNDAYQSIVGGKHPEALGQPASEVWREIWHEVGPRAEKAMRENQGTYDEALLLIMERHGYPEETYYTFSYSPVPNDQGGIGGLICANTDDTRRVIGERQLALLRALGTRTADARTVADAVRASVAALEGDPQDLPFALVYLTSPDGRTATLAGGAGIAPGHRVAPETIALDDPHAAWPIAEVLSTNLTRHVALGAQDDLPKGAWPRAPGAAAVMPISAGGQGARAGALVVGLNPFRLFDGAYRDFLELAAGQIAASIGNAKAYEEEKQRAEALAELDRAKTTFFSNVSHEFRTPLTLMLGPAEDLLAGAHGPLGDDQRREIERLHRNALRLQKLVNTLLDFSRIEAGRVDASYRRTDLGAFTTELGSVFRSAIEKAGLRFVVECAPVDSAFVDHAMWEKIVFNLLSNALKFTFDGAITLRVRTAGDRAELEVQDTGVGVSREELPRLFDRFHRIVGTRARSHEGSGIGLALVQELVRLHGGTVRAESEAGVGTRFVVSIPLGSAHLAKDRIVAEPTRASTEPRRAVSASSYLEEAARWLGGDLSRLAPEAPVGPAPDGERRSIVLADDNADMREYLVRLLADRYDVRAVANGREALAGIRAKKPDLVLSDVMMPELDGFGLLRALREDPATRTLPVIMLSARAGEEAKVEGLAAGADDYLVKPFSAKEIGARIAAHLEIARVRGEAESERAKLHGLFMSAPAVIALLRGPDHVFELANEPYLDLVGHREVLGRKAREALPELDTQGYFEMFDHVYRTNEPVLGRESRVRLLSPSGEERECFMNFVFAPYTDADGAVSGVAIYAFDVTDLVLAREAAEKATRARDEFLSVASHELRTPITSLSLQARLAERLVRAMPNHLPLLDKLGVMRRQMLRLEGLIDGLLDVSRIASGRLELRAEETDLGRLMREIVERHEPQARDVGSTVTLDAPPIVGRFDPLRFDQIVTNLLTNAMKYGAGKPIHLEAAMVDGKARVVVRDGGIGIAAKDLSRIYGRFERFVRSENYSGLGLGLWIVRSIVDAMGGTITVESAVGQGTTFTVTLPPMALAESA